MNCPLGPCLSSVSTIQISGSRRICRRSFLFGFGRLRAPFLAFATIALMAAWTRPADAEGAQVNIDYFTFDPPVLKVKAGTVVT